MVKYTYEVFFASQYMEDDGEGLAKDIAEAQKIVRAMRPEFKDQDFIEIYSTETGKPFQPPIYRIDSKEQHDFYKAPLFCADLTIEETS